MVLGGPWHEATRFSERKAKHFFPTASYTDGTAIPVK